MSEQISADILALTAQIVSAHVAHNDLEAQALPSLIQSVYRSLLTIDGVQQTSPTLNPAVPVKKSVFPDYIVCLEDGKRLKMLKRHLQASYGLSPDAYRTKWNLPRDYPMVAPRYAATRSRLAKSIGLGRKPATLEGEPAVTQVPARRARGSRA